jgi:hypothetical protein
MKVGELRKILDGIPSTFEVVLSSDGEGNSFSPLADTSEAEYQPLSTYDGELADEGSEEDRIVVNRNAVVLWPTR